MQLSMLDYKRFFALCMITTISIGCFAFAVNLSPVNATMSQIVHNTKSAFAAGTFTNTTLGGTETAPAIKLDNFTQVSWFFQNLDASGWSFGRVGGGIAEISPPGQVHLKANYVSGE
ncbi:hypothetical protein MUP79_07105, partial [Candidatus Bathyarchaeota archaeon]|nr:hypothetical protein [Candidatus Bathyarchaeota archaeon]